MTFLAGTSQSSTRDWSRTRPAGARHQPGQLPAITAEGHAPPADALACRRVGLVPRRWRCRGARSSRRRRPGPAVGHRGWPRSCRNGRRREAIFQISFPVRASRTTMSFAVRSRRRMAAATQAPPGSNATLEPIDSLRGVGPQGRPAESIQEEPFEAPEVVGGLAGGPRGLEEVADPGRVGVLPLVPGEVDAADVGLARAPIALPGRLLSQALRPIALARSLPLAGAARSCARSACWRA